MSGKCVVFFPEGAYGPTNNCVGIGEVLREHGHRVVFILEESFAGTLEARGFEERLMRLGPAPTEPEVPGQFWKDFIRDTAPVFRTPTIEQLGSFIQPTYEALVDGSRYVNPRLEEIIAEVAPDVIVEDNVVAFPALSACGVPWVRIVSCNPLEVRDPDIAPVFSGLPAGRPFPVGGVSRRVSTYTPRDVDALQRVHAGGRCTAATRTRVHAREPRSEPVRVPARDRLLARPPSRPESGTGSTRACAAQTASSRFPSNCETVTGRWSTSRSARSARPMSR